MNRSFPRSKNSHFQNEAKCKTFLVKMSFICINGFVISLTLKQRLEATLKWRIILLLISTGTNSDAHAGLRACKCLEGYYRTHMFELCRKCEDGLNCENGYATLKPGYWWKWSNNSLKDRYRVFIANLLSSSPSFDKEDVQYAYPLPTPHKCPGRKSCKGGMDSSCEDGYKGPLCSVCSKGYFKQFQRCRKCPTKTWIVAQMLIVATVILIIIAVCVWTNKMKNKKGGESSLADSFLSKIKIAIGFYQVTYGLLEAFSYIEWPESLRAIGKYSKVLQLNILEMAPINCFFESLQVDAFANLLSIIAINSAIMICAGICYGIRRAVISRKEDMDIEQKLKELSQAKETTYRNLFFFLYITYLSTCSKTVTALPLACRELCQDENEDSCTKYLKADYSIQCHGPSFNKLVIVSYFSLVYVVTLPFSTFIVLWRKRTVILDEKPNGLDPRTEMIKGLQFLYENYTARSWYWELIETSRKVVVTSGLILVGQESRSYIGLAWVIAGMYGVFFAWNRPIQDAFENRLMGASIAVTVFNLGVGAVSKIPAENLPTAADVYMDMVVFNILVLGANTLVIGLLACKMLLIFLTNIFSVYF